MASSITIGDSVVWSKGPYLAYLAPWGAGGLTQGKDYSDSLTLLPNIFPNQVQINWTYPDSTSKTAGVYNFDRIDFGDYAYKQDRPSIKELRVDDIGILKQSYNISLHGDASKYDVITDFFLTEKAQDFSNYKFEVEIFLHTPTYAKSYVSDPNNKNIGIYTDIQGQAWQVSVDYKARLAPDILIMPKNGEDLLSGSIDIQSIMNWLISKNVIAGNEFFNGLGMGVETHQGSGSITINSFGVDYSSKPAAIVSNDSVVLPYSLTQATLAKDAAGDTILNGPNGENDVHAAFEHYQFTDGTVNEHVGAALVDDLFYYVNNKDVWNSHVDASAHYNASGWHEGRNPNAEFSTTCYLAANPDVAKSGVNPLTEYAASGWKEGRDPSANFDNELYLANNPDVKAVGINPLTHYLTFGQAEGRQAYAAVGKAVDLNIHPGFDAEYYLLSNPDVAKAALAAGGDTFAFAYNHYETNGWKEGRAADAYFDSAYYLAHNPDVADAGIDPLAHYDQFGWKEGRDPSAAFHTSAYEAANPDVAAAHIDPMLHYLQYGALEARHLA